MDPPPPFGAEIEIGIPKAVSVTVMQSLDSMAITPMRQRQLLELRKHSIDKESIDDPERPIVIPITTGMCSGGRGGKDSQFVYKTGDCLSPLAAAPIVVPFPFNLSFAMTVHKAQGRTIDRVVLDLTDHPSHCGRMEFAAIFVALSRVCKGEHIRLLGRTRKHHCTPEVIVAPYMYLTKLKRCRHAVAFLHGYSGVDASPWNPHLAMQFTSTSNP